MVTIAAATSVTWISRSCLFRRPQENRKGPSATPAKGAPLCPLPKMTAGLRMVQGVWGLDSSFKAVCSALRLAIEYVPRRSGRSSRGVSSVTTPPSRTFVKS